MRKFTIGCLWVILAWVAYTIGTTWVISVLKTDFGQEVAVMVAQVTFFLGCRVIFTRE